MQTIIFPGNSGQPCHTRYAIVPDLSTAIPKVTIAVFQGDGDGWGGTSLWNSDESRNIVLNRILDADLRGIRLEFIRFVSAHVHGNQIEAIELPIRWDIDDYVRRGGRHGRVDVPAGDIKGAVLNLIGAGQKQVQVWSGDVVAGSCRAFTVFEQREHLSPADAAALAAAAGI